MSFERNKMKIEKFEFPNSYQIELAKKIAAGTIYQLRAEFKGDCDHIQAILLPWLVSWKEAISLQDESSFIQSDGVIWVEKPCVLDPVVRFIIVDGGPNLNQIRWFIDKLIDCHVAAETVNTRELYTGERIYEELDSLMTVPPTVMIEKAEKKLEEFIDLYKNYAEFLEITRVELIKLLKRRK